MNYAKFLKRVPLFEGLSAKDLEPLAKIANIHRVKKGQNIFSKATKGDTLYVVVEGMVKIFSLSRTGKTKTFAYLESKDFFGEMALLERSDRSAAALAVKPSVLLTIRRDDFQKLLSRRVELAFALMRTLCKRLRYADQEIESLSFNSVVGRIARRLLDLAKRHGKKSATGVQIQLELSHQELADMIGTAREMVTRILNRFARTEVLTISGKTITLTDPAKLRSWIY